MTRGLTVRCSCRLSYTPQIRYALPVEEEGLRPYLATLAEREGIEPPHTGLQPVALPTELSSVKVPPD